MLLLVKVVTLSVAVLGAVYTSVESEVFSHSSEHEKHKLSPTLFDIALGQPRGTMKKILRALSVTLATLSFGVAAQAQTIASCASVESLPSKNFIYKNAAPLRSGGVGTTLIGFRRQPTLIMNKFYTRSGTKVYDSQDNLLVTCRWADAHGHSGGRFRCTNSTSLMRRKAVKNTGSPTVYFVTNPRTKSCARVPDAGRCYGSVKGLCTSLID